jgi:hypothetical protein
VPSKFAIFDLAAACREIAGVIVLVETSKIHRGAYTIGARWWAKVGVCGCAH